MYFAYWYTTVLYFILVYHYVCIVPFAGSIKIWDFGSGQCIKEKQGRASEEDLSITGLVYSKLEDDRVLIASGWNNKLKILLVRECLYCLMYRSV